MRRMFSEKQIKALAQGVTAEILEGDVEIGGDLSVTGSINGEENPSVKPIYWHNVHIERIVVGIYPLICDMVILNNSPEEIDGDALIELLQIEGFKGLALHGYCDTNAYSSGGSLSLEVISLEYKSANDFYVNYYLDNKHTTISQLGIGLTNLTVTDSVNKIN